MRLDNCKDLLCNHPPRQDLEHLQHTRRWPHVPFQATVPSSKCKQHIVTSSPEATFAILEPPIHGIPSWGLPLFNTVFFMFMHCTARLHGWMALHGMNTPGCSFTYGGHWCCLQFRATMNKATLSILIQIFLAL